MSRAVRDTEDVPFRRLERTALTAGLAMVLLGGCGLTQNRLVPLIGEDETARGLSGERAQWLQRTGATRAVEDLREALRKGDGARAGNRIGPRTRERLQSIPGAVPGEEALLLSGGRRMLPPEIGRVVEVLVAEGTLQVQEEGTWDPGRRHARVRVVSPAGEVSLSAFFTEETGWRVECLPEDGG